MQILHGVFDFSFRMMMYSVVWDLGLRDVWVEFEVIQCQVCSIWLIFYVQFRKTISRSSSLYDLELYCLGKLLTCRCLWKFTNEAAYFNNNKNVCHLEIIGNHWFRNSFIFVNSILIDFSFLGQLYVVVIVIFLNLFSLWWVTINIIFQHSNWYQYLHYRGSICWYNRLNYLCVRFFWAYLLVQKFFSFNEHICNLGW